MCPECGAQVAIHAGIERHEVVSCPECNTELEVMSLEPPSFYRAALEEVDWGE